MKPGISQGKKDVSPI